MDSVRDSKVVPSRKVSNDTTRVFQLPKDSTCFHIFTRAESVLTAVHWPRIHINCTN
jgi:hypothetical protein